MRAEHRTPRRSDDADLRPSILWLVVAVLVAAVGCTLSLLTARDRARDDELVAERAFERTATDLTNTLSGLIQRQSDLVVSTGARYAADPDLSSGDLARWLDSVDAAERHPELLAVAVMRNVVPDELPAFADRLRVDPTFDLGLRTDDQITIVPPGDRASYCLLQAVVNLEGATEPLDPGIDYCAAAGIGPLLAAARDAATPSYLAVPSPGGTQLVVQAPIYAGGRDPGTVDARREHHVGSLGTAIDPDALFRSVLLDHPEAVITLGYEGTTSSASFSSGDVPPGHRVVVRDLGDGWSTTIAQPGWATGIRASSSALQVLAAGVAASAAMSVLVLVLGTGRRRARRLVAHRTDQLNHQAMHDALTDLPNRTLILDRAEQLLARCRRSGATPAAMYLDLDGFKDVNDSMGHDAGDQLLRAVASRLTTTLRGVDTVGRMGGDEFVVLVDGAGLDVAPELVAERLLEVLREPFELDRAGRPVIVTASVGIAVGHRETAGDLLRDADIALYRAKEAGRNCYETFHPEMEAAVQHQFEIESDLRTALRDGEFRLHFQPIHDLSDLGISGAEALIRWEHPSKGLLAPAEFIPRLEASGQIVEVGRWVLDEACRRAAEWRGRWRDLTISVNVSARQLDSDAIVDHVEHALAASGLEPRRLMLEITETTLMRNPELTGMRLHALKRLGVRIAIDDFGTGYSSLAYLQRFPVDCLKIDRSFTDAITRSPESDALARTLVRLGKELGLVTLAEGVETTGQLDYLRGVDVDQAQGFLFAHPTSVLAGADEDDPAAAAVVGSGPGATARR